MHALCVTHKKIYTHTAATESPSPGHCFHLRFGRGCCFISLPGEEVWPWEWDHTHHLLFTSLTYTSITHRDTHAHTNTHQCKVTQQLALIFQIKAQCDKQGHNTHMKWHSSLLSVAEGESSGHPTVTLSFTVVI